MEKKRVVAFGGGNGTASTLIALKKHAEIFDIAAVVSMSDSGGSSGRLRQEFQTLPPGDIMRAILALSPFEYDGFLKEIFYKKRFDDAGSLTGHNLGNLFLILAQQYAGSYIAAIRALEQAVSARGRVYPATLEQTDLVGELSSGEIIVGEHALDRPEYDRSLRIAKVWLQPETARAHDGAVRVIEQADVLLFGPGSLYCSVVASILPVGIFHAMKQSKAELVYLAGNKYEERGETGPVALSDFVHELESYLPRKVDTVIFNEFSATKEQKEYHKEQQLEQLVFDKEKLDRYRLIAQDFEQKTGGVDSEKLGDILLTLFAS